VAYDLRWTERAADDYEKLVDYLLEKWGIEITIKVTREINQTITHIKNSPEHFPILLKKRKRSVVVWHRHKHQYILKLIKELLKF